MSFTYIEGQNLLEVRPMGDNFFDSPAHAERAMRENLFTEVYLSTAVTTPIQRSRLTNDPRPSAATYVPA